MTSGSAQGGTGIPAESPASVDTTEPELADVVVAAVRSIPGVADLHPGMFGEAATHLVGRRVYGVQVRHDSTHVHVVLDWACNIPATADAIKSAVEPIVGTRVDVTVQDLTARK